MGALKSKQRKKSAKKKQKKKEQKAQVKACCDFPFLEHDFTVGHVRRSKVMFIMRGLSGSGKSTIVNLIKAKYKGAVCCSADDYFLQDGVYKFDQTKLSDAHSQCQSSAQEACEWGVGVVVIDNTNVKRWEMSFYLKLATRTNYVTVIVMPKTSWRFQPEELAKRNKHGVPVDVLQQKVAMFQNAYPVYYGWFLNEGSSKMLLDMAEKYFGLCCSEVKKYMAPIIGSNFKEGMSLDDFSQNSDRRNSIFHCTTFFSDRGRATNSRAYANSDAVKKSLGQAFMLTVVGFFFTPRTIGARVRLNPRQLSLWGKDDNENQDGSKSVCSGVRPNVVDTEDSEWTVVRSPSKGQSHCENNGSRSPRSHEDTAQSVTEISDKFGQISMQHQDTPNGKNTGRDGSDCNIVDQGTVETGGSDSNLDLKACLASGIGSRAHITIGCAPEVSAVQCGFDLMDIVQCEQASPGSDKSVLISGGKLRSFRETGCMLYLDEPVKVPALFSGFY